MKIGVFLPNWIGDAVMATPALRALRREFLPAEITAIARPYVGDVLAGLDLIDNVLFHDPRGTDPARRGWRFLRRLRKERFDTIVLFPNSLRTAWLARLSGAPRRVGLARDGRRWLLTDALPPKPRSTPHPVIDEYLRLAAHLGCRRLSRQMELATLPEDERRLAEFWSRQRVRLFSGCPVPASAHSADARRTPAESLSYVCLNPGGAYGSAKHWPTDSFAELAARIVRELGRLVLVLCGPAEREQARQIVQRARDERVVTLADVEPSIGLTKAAVRHSELLITTDSGPRHFAPPFQVPVITLFGPTHIAWSETFYPKAVHLQIDVDCGPCQKRTCPLGHHKCMRGLPVATVFQAARDLLRPTIPISIGRSA